MAHVAQQQWHVGGSWGLGQQLNSPRRNATRLDSIAASPSPSSWLQLVPNYSPCQHTHTKSTTSPPPLSTSPTLGLSPVSARQMKVATIARVAQATRNTPLPPRLKCKVCIASIFRQACRVRERGGGGREGKWGRGRGGWLTRGHESHVRS